VPPQVLSDLIGIIIERRHDELSAFIGTVAQLLDVLDRECSERMLLELSSALAKLLTETDYAMSGTVMTIGPAAGDPTELCVPFGQGDEAWYLVASSGIMAGCNGQRYLC
jgi:hypothetical protein